MATKRETYKGNALLVLMKDENDRYPFKFGLSKARLILENLDAIRDFVNGSQSGEEYPDRENRPSDDPGYPMHTNQY